MGAFYFGSDRVSDLREVLIHIVLVGRAPSPASCRDVSHVSPTFLVRSRDLANTEFTLPLWSIKALRLAKKQTISAKNKILRG
jgi:hypothetical protein